MSFIQIGNVTLKTEWGAFLLALLLFMLVEKFLYKKSGSMFQDVLFYYIIVWKFSYIIFEWPMFIKNPMSILYFNGGYLGHILGVIVAGSILIVKTKKQNEKLNWNSWLWSFTEFYLLFLGSFILLSGDWIVGSIILIACLLIAAKQNNRESLVHLYLFILLNSIFLAYSERIFTIEGWTFMGVTVVALTIVVMNEKYLLKNTVSWLVIVILATSVALNFEKANKTAGLGEAPDFELQTLSGESIQLSNFHGKKVILNFWATWCPPCQAEMPHMQSFYEEHGEEVEVIAVNLTSRDNGIEALEKFVSDYGLTFSIPLDVNGVYGDIYEVISIPTTYIIDESGQIYQKIVGPVDQKTLESYVEVPGTQTTSVQL